MQCRVWTALHEEPPPLTSPLSAIVVAAKAAAAADSRQVIEVALTRNSGNGCYESQIGVQRQLTVIVMARHAYSRNICRCCRAHEHKLDNRYAWPITRWSCRLPAAAAAGELCYPLRFTRMRANLQFNWDKLSTTGPRSNDLNGGAIIQSSQICLLFAPAFRE